MQTVAATKELTNEFETTLLQRQYRIKPGTVLTTRNKSPFAAGGAAETITWDFDTVGGEYELGHIFTVSTASITWNDGNTGCCFPLMLEGKGLLSGTLFKHHPSIDSTNPGMDYLPWHQITRDELLQMLPQLIDDFFLPAFRLKVCDTPGSEDDLTRLAAMVNLSLTPYHAIRKWYDTIPRRWVVSAANRVRHASLEDGELIIPSPRHTGVIMRRLYKAMGIDRFSQSEIKPWHSEEGFIDQYDEFMTREDAYRVAVRNNQIMKGREHISNYRLYSEMLY